MWYLWRDFTGKWCISDDYGTTITIGDKEEIKALIEELKKILEEEDKGN